MNPSTKALRWAALAALTVATTAHAAVFVQTVPFNFTASGTTTTSVLVNSGDLTGTVAPFDPALGTLNSFDVVWHLTYTLNFVNDASGTGTVSYISLFTSRETATPAPAAPKAVAARRTRPTPWCGNSTTASPSPWPMPTSPILPSCWRR